MRGILNSLFRVGLGLLCFFGSVVTGAEELAPKLLSEGVSVLGVDGTIIGSDVNDVWIFNVDQDMDALGAKLLAGTKLPLLPSGILETILTDANDRKTPRYRLSGQVTRYKGQNFLLPTYYLPLSTLKDVNEPVEPNAVDIAPVAGDPNLVIPPEVLAKLNQRRMLSEPRHRRQFDPNAPRPVAKSRGRVIVDRIGFIEEHNGHLAFVPDAWGRNVSKHRYGLLPCSMLEQTERQRAVLPEPVRFSVAGLVMEYKGRDYLLLQRAVRVYSYGNFGR